MDDDFNTPEAVAVLFDLATAANTGETRRRRRSCARWAACSASCSATQAVPAGRREADAWVTERIAAREAARKRKDFKAADDIRKELLDKGYRAGRQGGPDDMAPEVSRKVHIR